jgi:hypothetical protein
LITVMFAAWKFTTGSDHVIRNLKRSRHSRITTVCYSTQQRNKQRAIRKEGHTPSRSQDGLADVSR